jgi:Family of unknown function (DUF6502)
MPEADRSILYSALLSVLRPLAGVFLRFGMGYREFSELLKTAYVQAATEEYGVRQRPTNVARVAAMTGISRKEVRRIRAAVNSLPALVSRSAPVEVMHRWHTDQRFLDERGKPKALAWGENLGSFQDLVRCCGADLTPGSIRAELRRVGSISESADGMLVVRRRHVIPDQPDGRLLEGLVFGLRTIAETVAFNATAQNQSALRFQRVVHTRLVPSDCIAEAEAGISARLTRFSEEVDDYLADLELDPNEPPDTRTVGIGIGLYYHRQDEQGQHLGP